MGVDFGHHQKRGEGKSGNCYFFCGRHFQMAPYSITLQSNVHGSNAITKVC